MFQDKTIGRRALKISGPVSAANYWEAKTAPLNLTGRFVYIQVRAGRGDWEVAEGKAGNTPTHACILPQKSAGASASTTGRVPRGSRQRTSDVEPEHSLD